jgi:hypothetical protein
LGDDFDYNCFNATLQAKFDAEVQFDEYFFGGVLRFWDYRGLLTIYHFYADQKLGNWTKLWLPGHGQQIRD